VLRVFHRAAPVRPRLDQLPHLVAREDDARGHAPVGAPNDRLVAVAQHRVAFPAVHVAPVQIERRRVPRPHAPDVILHPRPNQRDARAVARVHAGAAVIPHDAVDEVQRRVAETHRALVRVHLDDAVRQPRAALVVRHHAALAVAFHRAVDQRRLGAVLKPEPGLAPARLDVSERRARAPRAHDGGVAGILNRAPFDQRPHAPIAGDQHRLAEPRVVQVEVLQHARALDAERRGVVAAIDCGVA